MKHVNFLQRGGEVALPLQAPNTFSMETINYAYRNTIIVCVSFVYVNNGTNVKTGAERLGTRLVQTYLRDGISYCIGMVQAELRKKISSIR